MNSKSFGTTALFAMPSFLSGAARVLDLGETFDEYNSLSSPEEADFAAIQSDWAEVGRDMQIAIDSTIK